MKAPRQAEDEHKSSHVHHQICLNWAAARTTPSRAASTFLPVFLLSLLHSLLLIQALQTQSGLLKTHVLAELGSTAVPVILDAPRHHRWPSRGQIRGDHTGGEFNPISRSWPTQTRGSESVSKLSPIEWFFLSDFKDINLHFAAKSRLDSFSALPNVSV